MASALWTPDENRRVDEIIAEEEAGVIERVTRNIGNMYQCQFPNKTPAQIGNKFSQVRSAVKKVAQLDSSRSAAQIAQNEGLFTYFVVFVFCFVL